MNYKSISIILLFLFMIWLPQLQAQQAVLTASNNATGTAGTVCYSVGQVAYILNNGTDGFLIEGVQQPFEYQFHIGIDEANRTSPECIVYPNPVSNYLILNVDRLEIKNLSYQLYNMNGFLLLNVKIGSPEVSIRMEDFAPASYSLTVSENKRVVRSFIIIKK